MSEDDRKESGFKVNDRRRFDTSGNDLKDGDLKDGDLKDEDDTAPKKADKVQGAGFISQPADGGPREFEVTFTSFVMSLATQALMQMGQIPPPEGVQIPRDKEAARHTIDILGMLELKTKGNLDPEEARLLQDALHSVRMCFVNAK